MGYNNFIVWKNFKYTRISALKHILAISQPSVKQVYSLIYNHNFVNSKRTKYEQNVNYSNFVKKIAPKLFENMQVCVIMVKKTEQEERKFYININNHI